MIGAGAFVQRTAMTGMRAWWCAAHASGTLTVLRCSWAVSLLQVQRACGEAARPLGRCCSAGPALENSWIIGKAH